MNSLFQLLKKSLTACLIALCSMPVYAFVLSNGDTVECRFARPEFSGVATEIWNTYQSPEGRNPELGRAVAVMRLNAENWPTIIIDAEAHKRTSKGTPAIWDFVYFHECAHAQQPSLSEIEANCASYKEMERRGLMNYNRMKELEAVHLGMMGNLPEEYGGSGAMFWHKTMQCVRDSNR
jgi:hypothetical protein